MLLAGVVVFSLHACGYTFAGTGALGERARGRALAVGEFENRTAEPEAALLASRATARALARAGAGHETTKPAGIVSGRVEEAHAVAASPIGPVQNQQTREWQVGGVALWRADARLQLVLRDAETKAIVGQVTVSGNEVYTPGSDTESTEVARRLALERLFERLAAEALSRL